MNPRLYICLFALLAVSCGPSDEAASEPSATANEAGTSLTFRIAGKLEHGKLDEASGMQAIAEDRFLLHNDEGKSLFVIDGKGSDLGRIRLEGAKSKDWEDITKVPGPAGPWFVIGDIGDNHRGRKSVRLYFFPAPLPDSDSGDYPEEIAVTHKLKLSFPDGPRDVESMAYDPHGGQILLLSKRDRPPRLYGVSLENALAGDEVRAEFLAKVPGFRPPTRRDLLSSPKRGQWVSQPTAMDISPDGRLAAVLTYRSLYLFHREGTETWPEAFQREPEEFVGPPGLHDEAVAFTIDQTAIYVTTERRPAPLYRLDL